jgi:glycosyltransferase involved in cell wall biosynthesis
MRSGGFESALGPELIRGKFIICLASRWDVDPTSKHHIMRRLSADNDVLWVNYHGSRAPRCNGRDTRAVLSALRRVAGGVKSIGPRMRQITPLVLPGAPTVARGRLNRILLAPQIARAMRGWRKPGQPAQIWTFAPDVDFLAGAFREEAIVYYCVDEFSEFEGFDAVATAAAERRLIVKSQVVLTSAARLYEARRDLHPHVHLVRHGVDFEHFARAAREDLPLPEELSSIPRPRAGFFGLLQHWFDVALLAEVARRTPQMSFVLIGDVQTDVTRLAALPNVHLLGRKPYADLPAYCRGFDVGLIPFVRSSMTENVNPIKLREYLAAGLPVVSTALPEVAALTEDMGDAIRLADDAESFGAAIRAAQPGTADERIRRSAACADQSWDGVTARVCTHVTDSLAHTAGCASADPDISVAAAAHSL